MCMSVNIYVKKKRFFDAELGKLLGLGCTWWESDTNVSMRHVRVCLCVYIHAQTYIRAFTHVFIYIYICILFFVGRCVCMCMHACMYVFVNVTVCMHDVLVRAYIYIYIYICMCEFIRMHVSIYGMYVCIYVDMHICTKHTHSAHAYTFSHTHTL